MTEIERDKSTYLFSILETSILGGRVTLLGRDSKEQGLRERPCAGRMWYF